MSDQWRRWVPFWRWAWGTFRPSEWRNTVVWSFEKKFNYIDLGNIYLYMVIELWKEKGVEWKEEEKVSWAIQCHRAIPRSLRLGKTAELCRNRGECGLDIQGHLHGSNWFSKDFSNRLPHSFRDLEPPGHANPAALFLVLKALPSSVLCPCCSELITGIFHLSDQVLCLPCSMHHFGYSGMYADCGTYASIHWAFWLYDSRPVV